MDKSHVDQIAKLAHEINRAYCTAIGDKSQQSWEETPETIKASARAGALHHLMNPETTPEESHALWLKYKVDEGWVYGDTKDIEKKLHPCMLPYTALPEAQRVKDYLFSTAVKQAAILTNAVHNEVRNERNTKRSN